MGIDIRAQGCIYSGIATPSEAAAAGVFGALTIVVVTRQFSLELMRVSILSTLRTSAMIISIILAAAVLSTAMAYLHIPSDVAKGIAALDLNPWRLLVILSLFYIGLGLFLDGTSMIVLSLPFSLPLIHQAGFDPIWFGIYLILMTEIAQVTPPVGFNLFVIQGITGLSIEKVARYALPFFVLMVIGIVIIALFPSIALWLPHVLYDR